MNRKIAVLVSMLAAASWAAAPTMGHVDLKDAKNMDVGEVTLEQTPAGLILRGNLKNVPAGTHALHFHQMGRCEAPAFKSAGDHFNPKSKQHGVKSPNGAHAGDLPNLVVPASGDLTFEVFAPGVTLTEGDGALLDSDGAALVLHAKPDDYSSQPSGNAGDRIACGVVQAK